MSEQGVAELLRQVVAALDSGEVRPGQVQMAEAVERAFAEGGVVAVAAGTGTGKSLAYLVPAVASGQCVVVATATKALQDQLANKDLPLVARGLGRPVNWAVLKGRSNYLCRQRLVELERLGEQQRLDAPFGGELTEVDQPADPSGLAVAERGAPEPSRGRRRAAPQRAVAARKVGEEVRSLVEWARSTGSGDRAELSFEPSAAAWSSLSVTADECPGSRRCPSGGECFAEAARARAASADIVVVNLHLLGAHLRCGGEVLPEHDALVIDEAHELEDVLAACLGVEVSPGRLRALASAGRAALSSAGRKAQTGENTAAARSVEAVLDAAGALEAVLGGREDQRLPPGLGGEIGTQVTLSVERLDRLSEELRRAVDASGGVGAGAGPTAGARTAEGGGDASQRCLRALLGVDRCREELTACLAAGSDEVVWVSGGSRPALRSAPLEVSGVLSAQVFSRIPVVLTSATMPRGLAARVGAPVESTRELDVGSPFAYRAQGLLYCATSLPDRRRPEAEAAIHDEIEALVLAAGGRTLALFTSRRAMTTAAEELAARLPWPVLVQGELPKAALLEALSCRTAACLFATMSFWQGVDVPGPALSLVVIDRIPFPRPDDPLMAARREAAGRAGFQIVDLPRAATLLAQGAGRLIRTASDRGVVAVLDPRLATASYGPTLVKALPPMRRTRDRAEAEAFLRGIHAEATAAVPVH